jgi:hypothetical protein
MDKICVNGSSSSPVYSYLKVASGDTSPILWNFAKFIVRRDGTVQGRWVGGCALVGGWVGGRGDVGCPAGLRSVVVVL